MSFVVPSTNITFPQWLLKLSNSSSITRHVGLQVLSFASFLSWSLWLARNELYFQSKASSPGKVVWCADQACVEFQAVWDAPSCQSIQLPFVHLSVRPPPTRNCIILHIDAVFNAATHQGGMVFLACNSQGVVHWQYLNQLFSYLSQLGRL
ncbi:hypothetical protein NE237_021790 [Protea cynaroides]|uniref:Uncharacterized protein n=1 Tax=Protea cynaroides TaxID=273540 RepID=A0A9Q0K4P7_9MAGN|nr:hypothetical protein NE237_021790 [Protea cynaroides]